MNDGGGGRNRSEIPQQEILNAKTKANTIQSYGNKNGPLGAQDERGFAGPQTKTRENPPCNSGWSKRRAVAVSVIDIGGFQY